MIDTNTRQYFSTNAQHHDLQQYCQDINQTNTIDLTTQSVIEYLENTTIIDSKAIAKYREINQGDLSKEELLLNCLETIHLLKTKNSLLPKIQDITIDLPLESCRLVTKKILDKVDCFQDDLIKLSLDGVPFEENTIPSLRNFSSLETLCISNANITKIAKNFCPPNLKKFVLEFCDLLVKGPNLKSASKLKELDLFSCPALTIAPKNLSSSLEFLFVNYCYKIIDIPDLKNFSKLKGVKNLKEVTIRMGGRFDAFLEKSSKSLTKLSFSSTSKSPLLFNFPNLEELDISGYVELELLPKGEFTRIKKLNVSYCSQLVEAPDLANYPYLQELNMQSCTKLTELPKNLLKSHLNKLNLSSCRNLTFGKKIGDTNYSMFVHKRNLTFLQDMIASLLNSNKQLTELNLSNVPSLINAFTDLLEYNG